MFHRTFVLRMPAEIEEMTFPPHILEIGSACNTTNTRAEAEFHHGFEDSNLQEIVAVRGLTRNVTSSLRCDSHPLAASGVIRRWHDAFVSLTDP